MFTLHTLLREMRPPASIQGDSRYSTAYTTTAGSARASANGPMKEQRPQPPCPYPGSLYNKHHPKWKKPCFEIYTFIHMIQKITGIKKNEPYTQTNLAPHMGKGHTRFTLMPHRSNDTLWKNGQLCNTFLTPQCSACTHEPTHPGEPEQNQDQRTCSCSQDTAADQDKSLSRRFLVVWLFFLGFVCLFGWVLLSILTNILNSKSCLTESF